jgi:hypothetical protein
MTSTTLHSIVLHSDGGLGNRLRPLLSLLDICANNKNIELKCICNQNQWCNADISKLFRNIEPISIENVDDKSLLFLHHCDNHSTLSQYSFLDKFKQTDKIRLSDNMVVSTPFWVTENRQHIPQRFSEIIRTDIRGRCCELKNDFQLGKHVIGCHLRGTDLMDHGRIHQIINLILSETDKSFFVCSDMEEYETLFSNAGHVKTLKKSSYVKKQNDQLGHWENNILRDENSVVDGLIDMCLLSFCDTSNPNYHSFVGSTFLDVAQSISGWELSK